MIENIAIMLDEDIGLYTIVADGEVQGECLDTDEVVEVIKELMDNG